MCVRFCVYNVFLILIQIHYYLLETAHCINARGALAVLGSDQAWFSETLKDDGGINCFSVVSQVASLHCQSNGLGNDFLSTSFSSSREMPCGFAILFLWLLKGGPFST